MSDDCRILLFDNDQNVLHLLKYALEERGMQVDCTTGISEALYMGRAGRYDVIVMQDASAEVGMWLRDAGCTTPFVMIGKKISIEQLVDAIQGAMQFMIV